MGIVKKTYTRSFEIVQTSYPASLGKYVDFVKARKRTFRYDGKLRGLTFCFDCGRDFTGNDEVYLALVKGHKNRLLCEKCAKKHNEALKEGVVYRARGNQVVS